MTKQRRRIAWPVRIVLALFVLLLVCYFAAVALLSTSWAHRWMERYVAARIEQVTGARVEIGRLEVHPAIFSAILHGLVLHGTEGPAQEPLLTAGTVAATLNPVLLLARKLSIRRLDVTGLMIHLYTAPDGGTNLPGPAPAARVQADQALADLVNLRIRDFSVSHSALYWNNQQLRLDLAAQEMALLLRYGPGHAYTGSFSSSPLTCRVRGQMLPPLTVATRFVIFTHQINLRDAVWRSAGGNGTASASVKLTDPLSAQFTLEGGASVAPFARVLGLSWLRRGELRLSATGTYAQGGLRASGHAEGRRLLAEVGGFRPGEVNASADFRFEPDRLALSRIRAQMMRGEASGNVTAEVRGKRLNIKFQGALQGIDLASFAQAMPGGPMALRLIKVDSSLSGPVSFTYNPARGELHANFDLRGAPQSVKPGVLMPLQGSASGSATIGKEFALQISSASLATAHSSLTAQGRLGSAASALQFHYHTTDFEESRPFVQYMEEAKAPIPLVIDSAADFSGTVHGPALRPEVRGELRCGPFRYAGYPWRGFSANLALSPALAQISGGRLLAGSSPLTIDLRTTLTDWQVTPASQMKATVEAHRSPVEGIRDALRLGYPVSGLIDANVSLQGTPTTLEGRGRIAIERAEVENEPIDLILAQGIVTNSVVDLTKIALDKGKGKLAGFGRVDLVHRTFTAELHGANFQLADFRSLTMPRRVREKSARGLEGTAAIRLQASGSFQNPQGAAQVDVRNLGFGGVSAGRFTLTAGLKGKALQLSAQLIGSEGSAAVTASATTEGDWPVQFSGKLENFRLDTGIDWVEGLSSRARVSAGGKFEGHGFLRRPATLAMEARIPELSGSLGGFTWKNRQPVHLAYASRKLTIDSFHLTGPSTDIQLGGSVRFTHPAELDLQATGRAEAALFSLMDPALQTAGTFDVQLRARGTLQNPELAGTILVKNLGFGYATFPFQVAGLNGKIELEGNHANIVELGSRSGQSFIQTKGFVVFGAHPRYNLTAALTNARLGFPTGFTSLLSGDLSLSGTEGGGELAGRLTVTQMFARPDFSLLGWLGNVGSPVPPASNLSNPLASRIRLNIGVSTSPDVSLETHDLSFDAVIDASLQGTVADPVALGTVHLRSGSALIRGNRYTITRGDITMTNPVRTQPVLNLEATTRVAHYDLTLDVAGPLDRAKISYRSDPPLPSENVLSLLALGYAPQLQQVSAGGTEPTAAVGASAILSQALSSQFSGRVQRLLGVSRIRIDPNLLGPTTAGGVRVTIEEQVGRNVTLTYSTNTGAAQQRDIRLVWDLSDRVSLIGEQDINGVYGIELRFRRRFK